MFKALTLEGLQGRSSGSIYIHNIGIFLVNVVHFAELSLGTHTWLSYNQTQAYRIASVQCCSLLDYSICTESLEEEIIGTRSIHFQ